MEISHYTSLQAGLSILQSIDSPKESTSYDDVTLILRAFHTAFMTDPTDSTIFGDVIEGLKIDKGDWNVASANLGAPYTVSFCEKKDSLSMWRQYTKGAKGLCFVFDKEKINAEIKELNRMVFGPMEISVLFKCKYIGRDMIREAIQKESDYLEYLKLKPPFNKHDVSALKRLIKKMQAMYKGVEYEDEHEWRVAVYGPPNVDYVATEYSIRPYMEVKFPFIALKEVIVGPCVDIEKTCFAIRQMLKKYAGHKVQVLPSIVKYTEAV